MEQKQIRLAKKYVWMARGSLIFFLLGLLVILVIYENMIPNNFKFLAFLLLVIISAIPFFYALDKRRTSYPNKEV